MGTVKVLEAIRQVQGVRACVIVTSDKCYDNKDWLWGYRESDSLGGYDPYSNSKGCAELVVSAYRDSFFNVKELDRHGLRIATARAGNVVGGGDWTSDQLVPDIVRAFQQNTPVKIRNPHAVRPWQFVLEPLDGYLRLAEYLWNAGSNYAHAWNFGPHPENAKPVKWIVDHVTAQWGRGAAWTLDAVNHPHESHYLKLDSSMANAILNWRPRLTLEQDLSWTVEWYRAYYDRSDIRKVTFEQLDRFNKLS
jgi:CDP-glucose 4,6-dehydratase